MCVCVSQVAALVGNEGDATPFTDVTVEDISQHLHSLGYQNRGWEVMYHGHTGRWAKGRVSIGSGGMHGQVHTAVYGVQGGGITSGNLPNPNPTPPGPSCLPGFGMMDTWLSIGVFEPTLKTRYVSALDPWGFGVL